LLVASTKRLQKRKLKKYVSPFTFFSPTYILASPENDLLHFFMPMIVSMDLYLAEG